MSEEKSTPRYYDEKAKDRIMRYQRDKMERVSVWVPKGTGAEWKARASVEDEALLDVETRRYSWREIALMDGLVECGCASCPWKDTCDAMSEEIEEPNELDDHPGSIF